MKPSDRIASRVALGSIGIGLTVLTLKSLAWWITGSAGLYSDALETLTNIATAIVAYAAFRYALRPADESHPYGHGKAELFAAVVEGALVTLAAVMILIEAWRVYQAPRLLTTPLHGLALNMVATVINGVWSQVLLKVGARARSVALAADAKHLRADVATSVGVTLGVTLAVVTGRMILDPIVAALTAVHVLWSGLRMISASVNALMDAAPKADMVDRIRMLVADHAQGALEAHDLRSRHAGRVSYLEFHLVVPGSMTVADAHLICDRIEAALQAEFEDLLVTIHVEPEGKAKHHGVLVL